MPDLKRKGPPRDLQILRRKHEESNTMLAILMAGVAALFIVGIVAAYNYASSTNPVPVTASAPPGTTTGSAAKAPTMPAETTGAGGAERGAPAQPKKTQ
jgi:hypothetical protein